MQRPCFIYGLIRVSGYLIQSAIQILGPIETGLYQRVYDVTTQILPACFATCVQVIGDLHPYPHLSLYDVSNCFILALQKSFTARFSLVFPALAEKTQVRCQHEIDCQIIRWGPKSYCFQRSSPRWKRHMPKQIVLIIARLYRKRFMG
jgi:hypothetical protein